MYEIFVGQQYEFCRRSESSIFNNLTQFVLQVKIPSQQLNETPVTPIDRCIELEIFAQGVLLGTSFST
jgi:hypothetical protein